MPMVYKFDVAAVKRNLLLGSQASTKRGCMNQDRARSCLPERFAEAGDPGSGKIL